MAKIYSATIPESPVAKRAIFKSPENIEGWEEVVIKLGRKMQTCSLNTLPYYGRFLVSQKMIFDSRVFVEKT